MMFKILIYIKISRKLFGLYFNRDVSMSYKFYFSFRYHIFAYGNRGQFIYYVSNVLNMKTIIILEMVANPMIELIYFIPVDYSFLTKLT